MATGSGLEYVVFGAVGLIPAVLVLIGLLVYVFNARLSSGRRHTLVWTYVITSALACGLLLFMNELPFLFSPLVWLAPLLVVIWRRSQFPDDAS
jgi:hypothetical protein